MDYTCCLCGRPTAGAKSDGQALCGHCWAEINYSAESVEVVEQRILDRRRASLEIIQLAPGEPRSVEI